MALTALQQIATNAAVRDPDGIAYRVMGKSLRFSDFDHRVAQLVHVLRESGVKPGDRVAICLRKSFESAISALAIIGAGGVYVPLDPTAPPERWAAIARQCGARHLISSPALQAKATDLLRLAPDLTMTVGVQGGPQNVSWDEVGAAPRGELVDRDETDAAYIMFTSGSTGMPKGMVHTHASALSYLRATIDLYDMTARDRIALHSGLHFDMSIWPLLGAPLVGACCVIVPEAFTRLPAEMSKLIAQEHVTLWYSVPYALIQMLEMGALDQREIRTLRWVIYAGEPFAPKPMRALMCAWPQTRFSNNYGPAEVNVVTYMHVDHPDDIPDGGVPIGRVMPHATPLVLDTKDQPLEAGHEGELVIATPAMMQGYWQDNERTNASMLQINGTRYYRSGDMVVARANGVFDMVGRKDRQIKVRGSRVELDEVEMVLSTHPDVLEAAALPSADGATVTAVVVLRSPSRLEAAALQTHAAAALPTYAVPKHLHIMADFPRTGSGKIDRRAIAVQIAGN